MKLMREALRLSLLLMLAVAAAGSLGAQAPNLPENGVVNAASFGPTMAPGSIVAIFGTNLASQLQTASTVPLSTSMGGVSVKFNGSAAPLFFVSPGQINAQLPNNLTGGGNASVVVETAAGQSATRNIPIASFSPSIFALGTQGVVVFALEQNVFAAVPPVQIPGGGQIPACQTPPTSALCARPAKAGDFLVVYANGLGATAPAVPDGNGAPSAEPFARTTNMPEVTLAGARCNVLFAGLVPGLVGLYQINIQLPQAVTAGNAVALRISMGGVTSSDQVTIAVQ